MGYIILYIFQRQNKMNFILNNMFHMQDDTYTLVHV